MLEDHSKMDKWADILIAIAFLINIFISIHSFIKSGDVISLFIIIISIIGLVTNYYSANKRNKND